MRMMHGPPLLEELPVLFAPGILVNQIEHPQVAGRVPHGPRPVLELKEPHITKVKQGAFTEQFIALLLVQLESAFPPTGPGGGQPFEKIIERRFPAPWPDAVGPTVQLILLDGRTGVRTWRSSRLVLAFGKTGVVLGVERPVLEDIADVATVS